MNYNDLIANSNTALCGGEFLTALEFAKKAIEENKKDVHGYFCAGKAAMSMDRLDEAINYFSKAVLIDKSNANALFFLGYAQAMNGKISDALGSLTRAVEMNCDDSLKGQIYKMMAVINQEQGDFENALLNLDQSAEYVDFDYELLQQKAACYAAMRDYKQTMFVLNQMKLLKPSDYATYSLAFNIFMEIEFYEEAKAELERAEKFADLTMAYYNDKIAYTMLHDPANDTKENIKSKWLATLKAVDDGLKKGKPSADQVFELYLRAVQLYLSLELPEMAVKILDVAIDPISSYNSGFSILSDSVTYDESSISDNTEISPEDEEILMQEKWDNGEFDDIRETISNVLYDSITEDSEELSEEIHQYLSPIDALPSSKSESETYSLSGEFRMEQLQMDMRNSLYIAAYELLKDYDKMFKKARELQSSSIVANQYSGIYYELKVGKYTAKENWEKKYKERINFWTKRLLEDPTDFISAGYRIRSYIDIGDYENAEMLCACLPTDVKSPLMEEINKAKSQGGGEDVSPH